jgi:hypothetical protein
MTELLIGCGNDRKKKVRFSEVPDEWTNLTTLDIDPEAKPDVVHDLNVLPYPFEDNQFTEIHAYEVLEGGRAISSSSLTSSTSSIAS